MVCCYLHKCLESRVLFNDGMFFFYLVKYSVVISNTCNVLFKLPEQYIYQKLPKCSLTLSPVLSGQLFCTILTLDI